ncbi:hypothetical protein [Flavobacterium sp.]|jgi:hypothetical protein|uniref:hypothetical protein n=1 Tax=Flavobacterium sp. TaxID=239 RepID=UPI0037BF169A
MTDDIVTRLRERAASEAANESYFNSLLFKAGLKEYMINSLSYEAADAIEDYQADLKRHFDMITKQREDIERLSRHRDQWLLNAGAWRELFRKVTAENDIPHGSEVMPVEGAYRQFIAVAHEEGLFDEQ